ncbi:molecular chaperone DnaJ [Aerosakkonema sp. BLCC-F183]|uniref:molecular chaperone DnaJ n=1 Tax=Aerosakkonema sp. BLCC-F183 TaxID=3342834 RepID=UPI0035B7CEEB
MPRKKQPSHTSTPSSITLALSEQRLRADALDKEHQWLLKQIKKKRTELHNFVEQMRSVATQIFHHIEPEFQKVTEIDREIHALFNEILNTRKLGQKTKQDILAVYRSLQFSGLISAKPIEEETDPELDQLFEPDEQENDFSQNSTSSDRQSHTHLEQETTRTEESRKIRQTFLRLAEIFHPDKVTDSESQMRHTEIMKELNRAYQENDLAKLLEIEKQHLTGEDIDSFSEDDLTRQCHILEQQNSLLKKQYENLKQELRLAKNTPEGALVSDYRQATKLGIDPLQQMLAQTEKEMKIMVEIRNFVKDFRDKKMTVKEFIKGPDCLTEMSQTMRAKLLEEIFGIPVTIIDF